MVTNVTNEEVMGTAGVRSVCLIKRVKNHLC